MVCATKGQEEAAFITEWPLSFDRWIFLGCIALVVICALALNFFGLPEQASYDLEGSEAYRREMGTKETETNQVEETEVV